MSTLLADKPKNDSKVRPSQILGAMGWMDEIGFEMETPSVSSITQGVKGVFEDIISLGQDITGLEPKNEDDPENSLDPKAGFPPKGSLEFNKTQAKLTGQEKDRKEADRKKAFYQNLKDDQLRAHQAKERMWFEEEINDQISGYSTEQTNELLHLQADYKDNKSVYHRAELRKKLIEQGRKKDQQQKEASIPSPAKKISALEGAFEGASGKVGSGTANFGKGSVQ